MAKQKQSKAKLEYTLSLHFVNAQGAPMANLRVQVWDKDNRYDDFLAEAQTDANGHCTAKYSMHGNDDPDGQAEVYFKLWRGDKFAGETDRKKAIKISQSYTNLSIIIGKGIKVVQEKMATKPLGSRVKITNQREVTHLYEVLDYLKGEGHLDSKTKKGALSEKAQQSIREIQKQHKLKPTGELDSETLKAINNQLIAKKYEEPEHLSEMQKSLQRLDYKIERTELEEKKPGQTTQAALRLFQEKYKLPVTGKINYETEKRITSVIASRYAVPPPAPKTFKFNKPEELKLLSHPLRLNMQKDTINDLQKALAWMGFPINQTEVDARQMGVTTRNAVMEFQKQSNIPITREVDRATAGILNAKIKQINASAVNVEKYRVRGSVRDALWVGKQGIKIVVYEKGLRKTIQKLGEQDVFKNGFYDILYTPPINPDTGKIKNPYHLEIRVIDGTGTELDKSIYFNAGQVIWANFTEGPEKYQGNSVFEDQMHLLTKSLQGLAIEDIEETVQHRDIYHLYEDSGIPMEQIMLLSLSHRLSRHFNQPEILTPEAVFAFLQQNLPPELPDDLAPTSEDLDNTSQWPVYIAQLIETVSQGLVFLEQPIQEDALESAVAQNLVPRKVSTKRSQIISALQQLRTDYALEKPLLVGDGNLHTLLQIANISDTNKQQTVARYFLNNRGVNQKFWDELQQGNNLTNPETRRLKTTLDLGVIAKNNAPTVAFLLQRIEDASDNRLNATRDSAKLNQEGWLTLINENDETIPENITGADPKAVYAQTMMNQAELLFPSVSFVSRVKEAGISLLDRSQEVADLVYNDESVDLRTVNLDKFGQTHSIPDDVLTQAKVLQRVRRIAPTSQAGVALLKENLHSSVQIYFKGKDRLTEALAGQNVDKNQALRIFQLAEAQYANLLARIGQYRFDLLRDNPSVISSFTYSTAEIDDFKQEIPNIETLFGSLDYCDCEHCKSVYSPAAYFADILRFLEEKDAIQTDNTVKDVLFERRPDLGNILLSCENTNTPMPYIDLVNEVLEHAIPLPEDRNFTLQSSLTAKELRAIPEHVRRGAYDLLGKAQFPINSHFNLWQETSRTFLQHLGVPRYKLMVHFQNGVTTVPSEISIAAEYFGISSQETEKIINAETNIPVLSDYWGFNAGQTEIPIDVFLGRAQLKYTELLELIQVKFVNPDNDKSQVLRPVNNCDTGEQIINLLSPEKLDRTYRFLRLWRHLPWKMWELDQLIRSPKIGKGILDHSCIVHLNKAHQIQEYLKLDANGIQVLYDSFNRETRISIEPYGQPIATLYDKLFLNITIINPIDPAFEDPNSGSENRTSHRAAILAALAITDADLSYLDSILGNDDLTEANLSALYRYALLSQKLKVRIPNLLCWMDVLEVSDPFLDPTATWQFLERKKQVSSSGYKLNEFEYVRRYAYKSPMGLRKETITQYLNVLRSDLAMLHDNIFNGAGSLRKNAADQLGKFPNFMDNGILETALDLIGKIGENGQIESHWVGTNAERETFIQENFAFITDISEALTTLQAPVALTESQMVDRYQYIFDQIYTYLRENLIIEHFSKNLSTDTQIISILIKQLKLGGAGSSLFDHYENILNVDAGSNYLPYSDQHYLIYYLLHKCKLLLSKSNFSHEELLWLLEHSNELEIVDLSLLPVQTLDAAENSVSSINNAIPWSNWENWNELNHFKHNFPDPEGTRFIAILDKAVNNDSSLLQDLNELTQIEKIDFETLKNNLGWPISNFKFGKTYKHLSESLSIIKRTGVSEGLLFNWANRDDDSQEFTNANAILQACKSKYDDGEWLEKLKPLQDGLREKKRDALADFLKELSHRDALVTIDGQAYNNPYHSYNWDWQDNNDLFSFFLIDVDMSSCMLTSRLKQALNSVQLFVQRCFLNLEPDFVKIPKDDPDIENSWTQWKWMKNYRIWEANRKVFLYPENWIEPELRDDKSPFFEELESELRQNELTATNAESAFLSYLQKVDEVSRLEVTGVYHEMEGSVNRIHVVGRTSNQAPNYYYRYYDLNYNQWSPWEKVDADITGEHVIPVVYNRKVHLFWLVFMEKSIKLKRTPPAKASNSPTGNPEQPKLLEIQLAWSIRSHKGWSGKKISKRKLIHPWDRPQFSYNLRPRYRASDNALMIDLFISTSMEFNNTLFYDQYTGNPVKLTQVGHNENYRPWHSSSFVFDGEVRDVKLKGIAGVYYLGSSNSLVGTSSYHYLQENFEQEGRQISPLNYPDLAPGLRLPNGMHFENTRLVNNRIHSINNNKANIISFDGTTTLLNGAKAPFEVVQSNQGLSHKPLFFQDTQRSFFVKPELEEITMDYQTKIWRRKYVFYPFYHPYTDMFIRELNRSGLDGFFKRNIQENPQQFYPQNNFSFSAYAPVSPNEPHKTAEKDIVDFTLGGAYSIYNWEAFFHAPLLIANLLNQNQRFEEAMDWFHYIFDPTNTENRPTPQRYWITKPFFEQNAEDYRQQRITEIMTNIEEHSPTVMAWRNNPFKPHLIARYRPVAYQRNVVMRYIKNLVDWGDMLFRRDSIEAINEASQLYVLAYEILGPRPDKVPGVHREYKSYNKLTEEQALDIFGNQKVEVLVENLAGMPVSVVESTGGNEPLPRLETLYFCIPRNEKLDESWNLVEDRLFKIRNCMNIEGVVRQLPLFEPPIDPALLVKAAAQGLDLTSVLNDISAPSPHYRFRTLAQKAVEFCSEVKGLGEKLLSILEKKDAEALGVLRQNQEIQLLDAVKDIRKKQIDEAKENIAGLERSKAVIEERYEYYANIEKLNSYEETNLSKLRSSQVKQEIAQGLALAASIISLIPEFDAGASGFGGTPTVKAKAGGLNFGQAGKIGVDVLGFLASIESNAATMASIKGGHERRWDDWKLQERLAEKEIKQIEKQILASEIRLNIAEKELDNQELQIENSKTVLEYLKNKYTNEQLYNWMLGEVATVYFQSYQLAYEMAKRAESSFQHELGIRNTSYIKFGYWDSLKKGLVAGNKLSLDIRRLEAAFLDQHVRELEITKQISLMQVDPKALLTLKTTGKCELSLSEWLYNMDFPRHYNRRIKSVSISIPCIAGPYTSINCTLSLIKSTIRISNLVGSDYERDPDSDDSRFIDQTGTIQSIATSNGQKDSGMFQLNFNDARFLPFEGSGAVSTWNIDMPLSDNQFDFSTISDVIIHMQYTSREGGFALAEAARDALEAVLPSSGARLLSMKAEFPTAWHRFLHPTQDGDDQEMILDIKPEHFPFFARNKTISIKELSLVFDGLSGSEYIAEIANGNLPSPITLDPISEDSALGDFHAASHSIATSALAIGTWRLKVRPSDIAGFNSLPVDEIPDIFIYLKFDMA
jgi:peptidoglycan hydrolase-like protein with peptidoglycan-binding domain/5-hydroxyisourate hydrolase-like protein (transthyretin family)